MNRDEQKQILGLIDRALNGASDSPIPTMDVEADAIIRALFVRNPEAAYRVTMLAIAQTQEIEALRSALAAPDRTAAQGLLARFFSKRALTESLRERQIRVLERPVNG
jgi:hypothetical protein